MTESDELHRAMLDSIADDVISRFLQIPPELDEFLDHYGGQLQILLDQVMARDKWPMQRLWLEMEVYQGSVSLRFRANEGRTLYRLILARPGR